MFEQSGVLFLRDTNLNNRKKDFYIFVLWFCKTSHLERIIVYQVFQCFPPFYLKGGKKINSLEILFHDIFFSLSSRHLFLPETSFFPRHFTYISTPSLTKTSISALMPFTYASNYSLFMTIFPFYFHLHSNKKRINFYFILFHQELH